MVQVSFSDMYMNGDVIAASYCSDTDARSCTNTVVIHCESGSRVYIQCGTNYACQFRSDSSGGTGFQTFSGFLLSAEDDLN